MKESRVTLVVIAACLLLVGCADHSPTKQGGTQYSSLVSETADKRIYESINMQCWSDRHDNPVVALISFSSRSDATLIGWEHNFTDGKCTYIKMDDGTGKREIPLYEPNLVKERRVPVYYAIDAPGIKKTTLSFDRFASLKTEVENKSFAKAKGIVLRGAEQENVPDKK